MKNPDETPSPQPGPPQSFDFDLCFERDMGRAVVLVGASLPTPTPTCGVMATPLVMEAVVNLLEPGPDPSGSVLVLRSSGDRLVVQTTAMRNLPDPVIVAEGCNHPDFPMASHEHEGWEVGDDDEDDDIIDVNLN